MKKVKIFAAGDYKILDQQINEWISGNEKPLIETITTCAIGAPSAEQAADGTYQLFSTILYSSTENILSEFVVKAEEEQQIGASFLATFDPKKASEEIAPTIVNPGLLAKKGHKKSGKKRSN